MIEAGKQPIQGSPQDKAKELALSAPECFRLRLGYHVATTLQVLGGLKVIKFENLGADFKSGNNPPGTGWVESHKQAVE